MIEIKKEYFAKIHSDYKGMMNGKRTVFAGCVIKTSNGTAILTENIDFIII